MENAAQPDQRMFEALEHFRAAYESLGEFNDIMVGYLKERVNFAAGSENPKEDEVNSATNLVVNGLQMIGKMSAVKEILDDVHHQFGHLGFDACWKHTEVGEEDSAGHPTTMKDLLQEMMNGDVTVEHIDLVDPEVSMKEKFTEFMRKIKEA